ncbi:Protein kinase [Kickxella alabastrina]|nr:Protein kinase [Kickxella alabastrina]
MYKMRLRGPHANAAPRVSSPLVPVPAAAVKPGSTLANAAIAQQQQQQQVQQDQQDQQQQQQAVGLGVQGSPSRTPSNYFRASLPPLAATPGSLEKSNSSSITSLAHASLKASPGIANPYSHRNDSSRAVSPNGTPTPPSGMAPSPLARTSGDVEMAEPLDPATEAAQRRPTVVRKRAKLTRTRWHFGIRSRSPPADVMAEVYRALQQLNMTWKHFNPYHLRARYVPPGGTLKDAIKIDLQLYKLDSRDNYLVDFKAVIPQPRAPDDDMGGVATAPTYRAGENTLISPLPPFIQAARRRMSTAMSPNQFRPGSMYTDHTMAVDGDLSGGAEPRSLDDQFLNSNYPIQLPAELPATRMSPIVPANDRSEMLPEPDSLPAKVMQRRLGGGGGDISSPSIAPTSANGGAMQVSDSEDYSHPGVNISHSLSAPGIPIPGSVSKTRAMDIPMGGSACSPSATMNFVGGTPRSQGRAPGSYMPGSVVGRVSLARTDVSLTADGVGAGSGANRQSQERVVNIFPFFDVCCKLITELAVPSGAPSAAPPHA